MVLYLLNFHLDLMTQMYQYCIVRRLDAIINAVGTRLWGSTGPLHMQHLCLTACPLVYSDVQNAVKPTRWDASLTITSGITDDAAIVTRSIQRGFASGIPE